MQAYRILYSLVLIELEQEIQSGSNVHDIQEDIKNDLITVKEYIKNKSKLSNYFPSLIRMSLRLLCETASKEMNLSLDKYLKDNFENAKSK